MVLAMCLGIIMPSLCGCTIGTQKVVETSIVYVTVDSGDKNTETSGNPTVSTSKDSETSQVTETEATNNEKEIVDAAIKKAEEAIAAGDYDGALSAIAEANHKVTDKTELQNEKNRIESLRPVPLKGLNMLSGNPDIFGMDTISTGESFNCIGVTLFDIDAHATRRNTIAYATQGKYDKFTATLALMNDNSKNSPLDCFIEVYCDGIKSYTSPSIKKGDMPVQITADISGADKVEIKFCVTNNTNSNWKATDWSTDKHYPISFSIAEAAFCPKYTPRS